MSVDALIALSSLGVVLLANIIYFTVHLTKIGSRTSTCESQLILLHKKNHEHSSELKSLGKIEAQLELLIKHIIPQK